VAQLCSTSTTVSSRVATHHVFARTSCFLAPVPRAVVILARCQLSRFLVLAHTDYTWYSLELELWYSALSQELIFLAESVPERRNLHLKFQNFSGMTPQAGSPLQKVVTHSHTHTHRGHFSHVLEEAPPAVRQTVMLWGISVFSPPEASTLVSSATDNSLWLMNNCNAS